MRMNMYAYMCKPVCMRACMHACTRTCMYVSMVTITRESCKSYEKATQIELGHLLSKQGGASGNIGIQLPGTRY